MIDTQYLQHFAAGIFYEMVDGVRKACPITSFIASIPAATANSALANGVTGKKIRLLSLNVKALTVITGFDINSFNGGGAGAIFSDWAIYQQRNYWQNEPCGIVDTPTGDGLSATTAAGGTLVFSGTYIYYTPIA